MTVAPDAPLRAGVDQPRPDLQVMEREGLVTHLGAGVYLPSDAQCSTRSRVVALLPLVPAWTAAGLEAAAWVHGGPLPSLPLTLVTRQRVGARRVPDDVRVLETTLTDGDVTQVHGLRVTAPARTVVDLLRWGRTESSFDAARWLLQHAVPAADVRRLLEAQNRFRHQRLARVRLRALRSDRDALQVWATTSGSASTAAHAGPGTGAGTDAGQSLTGTSSRSARVPVSR